MSSALVVIHAAPHSSVHFLKTKKTPKLKQDSILTVFEGCLRIRNAKRRNPQAVLITLATQMMSGKDRHCHLYIPWRYLLSLDLVS